jgi:uncharacterized protein DUF3604
MDPANTKRPSQLKESLREPLFHFVLLGAAIFAAEAPTAIQDRAYTSPIWYSPT